MKTPKISSTPIKMKGLSSWSEIIAARHPPMLSSAKVRSPAMMSRPSFPCENSRCSPMIKPIPKAIANRMNRSYSAVIVFPSYFYWDAG
ncbi:MAG: hypothetical protein PVF83_05045 [Anaerolineales bacterium]